MGLDEVRKRLAIKLRARYAMNCRRNAPLTHSHQVLSEKEIWMVTGISMIQRNGSQPRQQAGDDSQPAKCFLSLFVLRRVVCFLA